MDNLCCQIYKLSKKYNLTIDVYKRQILHNAYYMRLSGQKESAMEYYSCTSHGLQMCIRDRYTTAKEISDNRISVAERQGKRI